MTGGRICEFPKYVIITDLNLSGVGLLSTRVGLTVVEVLEVEPEDPVLEVDEVVVFILSSRRQEAMKLKPRNSSWALALGGTPGESVNRKHIH
jgi:hypothetical protein